MNRKQLSFFFHPWLYLDALKRTAVPAPRPGSEKANAHLFRREFFDPSLRPSSRAADDVIDAVQVIAGRDLKKTQQINRRGRERHRARAGGGRGRIGARFYSEMGA